MGSKIRALQRAGLAVFAVSLLLPLLSPLKAYAADPPADFALQVTPSPLVATVKPGETTTLELKIRNGSTGNEELKIEPRAFAFDSASSKISIDDTAPPDIADWVSFSAPAFTVKQGEWYSQKVRILVPKEAGFSYSFTLVISRKNAPKATEGGRLIKGSLAVFTLINVDRPGATRKLEVPEFTASKGLYEYLPASFDIQFKNTGNSIVQPYGNVFVQRGSGSEEPISTLKVNDAKAYILPGTARTITTSWNDGFPSYVSTTKPDGTASQKLTWNWDTASQFRIGKYTAKLVAVYNDGTRDIPIEQTISFWVIPWRAILAALGILGVLIAFGRWRSKKRTAKAVRKALAEHQANSPSGSPASKDTP